MSVSFSYTMQTPISVQFKGAVQLQKHMKDDFEFFGKTAGQQIQKSLKRTTSWNGYIRITFPLSKRNYTLLKKFVKLEKWKYVRKSNNCTPESHMKITRMVEFKKFVPQEYHTKRVGINYIHESHIVATVLCDEKNPVFLAYSTKKSTCVI